MDGCAVASESKARRETAGCRLVALTECGRLDVQRTRDAGFDLHLTKRAGPDTLVQMHAKLAA
jgi:CheY-like chemotaxis protein